jgi:hypothetical protein
VNAPLPPDWAADVDLDAAPAVPARRPETLVASCVAIALVMVLAAAALHSALTRGGPVDPARATAVYDLVDVVATPEPVALLAVTLLNSGNAAVTAEGIRVEGAGLIPTTTGVQRRVEPGAEQTVELRAALDCRPDTARATPPAVSVRVRLAGDPGQGVTTVTAIGLGSSGQVGGLCAQAGQRLPSSAQPIVSVVSARFDGPSLHLTVAGAPAGASMITGRAAGWLLPTDPDASQDTVDADGRITVTLEAPVPGCGDTTALDVVPSGVQLVLVPTEGGLITRYAQVGPSLARWLLDAYARACPATTR